MAATMEASTDFPLSVSFRSASDTAGRLLPGLSDDIALMCLALVPRGYWGVLKCVSKAWRGTLSSEDICTAHLTPFTMNGKQQVAIYNDSTSPSVIF
ncbi:unnamed protein product [Closterium sp. Yama58-4]|nr:unnamed protein product [Closterium sp. Yama58-4]